jgi:hypothetical protein
VVIEAWQTSPRVSELFQRVQDPQTFLRMAAIELRRIAEQDPDIAVELRDLAQNIEAEAEDLARRNTKTAPNNRSRSRLQREKRGAMLYIVEVAIGAGNLALELNQMRTWLDHMKFQAIGFRQIPGANICRVDFEGEQEARAFAQAFAGQVLNRTAA